MSKIFTDDNFQKEVLDSDKLSVVDFWATWCGPCRIQGPIIEELASEYGEAVNIGKLDVDENPQIAMNFQIMSIPTLKFFKDGKIVAEFIGLQSKDALKSKIEELK